MSGKINRTMTPIEWAMLLTLSVLWGGSFFFQGVAVQELPTLTIVLSRVLIAAVVLFVVMRLSGVAIPRSKEVWLAFFGMGLLNNVIPFSLIIWGQSHIASGLASILNATTPLFTVVVAHFLTSDERLTVTKVVGVLAGLTGVAVMIGAEALGSLGVGVVAQLAVLAAALTYAFAGVFGRRFRAMGVTPIATAAGQVTASTVLLTPFVLVVDRPWTMAWPSVLAILAVLALAVLSTALAYILFFRILASAGATNLLLVTFLIPVSAVLLGIFLLDETLFARHAIGMALIALGLIAIDGRLLKRG